MAENQYYICAAKNYTECIVDDGNRFLTFKTKDIEACLRSGQLIPDHDTMNMSLTKWLHGKESEVIFDSGGRYDEDDYDKDDPDEDEYYNENNY